MRWLDLNERNRPNFEQLTIKNSSQTCRAVPTPQATSWQKTWYTTATCVRLGCCAGYAPFSIRHLLHYDLLDKLEHIQTISTNASKEYSLEKTLEKMHADWDGLVFRVVEYKDTGTFVVGGTDEIQVMVVWNTLCKRDTAGGSGTSQDPGYHILLGCSALACVYCQLSMTVLNACQYDHMHVRIMQAALQQ